MNRAGPRGVSLVELVIAVLILSMGTLAAYRGLNQARRGIGDQPARFLAHLVALNRAEELHLTGFNAGRALPDTERMGPFVWQVSVTGAETRVGLIAAEIRVSAAGQPGARLLAIVPALPAGERE